MISTAVELKKLNGRFYVFNRRVSIQMELNESGYRIIRAIQETKNIKAAFEEIQKEYEIEKADFADFVDNLKRLCIVVENNSTNKPLNWTVEWDITNGCNLRCKHCMVSSSAPLPDELSTQQAFDLIDQLSESEFKIIVFSGGEPLSRKDFPEILKYAYKKGFYTKLLTNASLIDDSMAKLLAENDILFCQISLDGSDTETFGKIRGKGVFEKVVQGLKNLKKYGLNFGATMVVTSDNYMKIEETLQLAISLGASSFAAGQLQIVGRALNTGIQPPPFREKEFEFDKIMRQMGQKYQDKIIVRNYIDTVLNRKELGEKGYLVSSCSRIDQGISIFPDGTITFCKGFYGKCDAMLVDNKSNFSLGRFPQDSISTVLKKRNKYNFNIVDNSSVCQKCFVSELCLGGCPAEHFIKNGDFVVSEGQCDYKDELLELKANV